jgi:hypothetical protein
MPYNPILDGNDPAHDCWSGHHLWVDVYDGADRAGAWCLWCGVRITDPDRITDAGAWLGVDPPDFRVVVPDRFTRTT